MALDRRVLDTGWEFKLLPPPPPASNHHSSRPNAREETGGSDHALGEERWLPVDKVPTEIHLDLLRHGIIPDPFRDFNELAVRWVAEREWTYRCTFASPEPPETSPGTGTDLVFEGLDTFATVWLNGEQILSSDNMFVSHRVDVTGLLRRPGDNELVITFASARQRGLELVKQHPEHRFLVHQTEVGRGAVRKAQYQWGWDWGPILLTCGPWKPVFLETYSARIYDVHPVYTLSEDLKEAHIDVSVMVKTSELVSGFSGKVELLLEELGGSVGCRTIKASRAVEAHHDKSAVKLDLDIPNPKLWWPRDHGPQNLLSLKVRLLDADGTTELDSVTKTTGLRRAELVKDKDAFGESFYVRVNGVDVFCGGSCWIPADSFLTRTSPEKYEDWVRRHIAAGNQNMVRVWGGGIYEHDAFFDACDRAGVLVWQDFAFACANYPAHPESLQSVETEARQNVARLRYHPSLVIWAGNNEDYQVAERWGLQYDFEGDKDPQSWLKTDFPARYIYEHLLPKVVREESAGTIYHPSSPWGNGTSPTLAVDPTVGDVHQWNVWHGTMRPYQCLPDMGGRFVSEFGMEAYPHLDAWVDTITDPEQQRPGSMALDFRNKAIGHTRRMLTYVGENLDRFLLAPTHEKANPLERLTHLTQVVQADTMRTAYRSWRRQWGVPGQRRCGGALVWQLNDCWPTVSWSVVDYAGVRKPAWYAIRDAMAALTVNVTRRFWDHTTRPADELWTRETGHVDPGRGWTETEKHGGDGVGLEVWVANSTNVELTNAKVHVFFISVRTGRVCSGRSVAVPTIRANGTTELHWEQQQQQQQHTTTTRASSSDGEDDGGDGDGDRGSSEPFDPDAIDPQVILTRLRVNRQQDGEEQQEEDAIEVSDVCWPSPLKYLPFEKRGVKVKAAAEEDSSGGGEGWLLRVTAQRPVKGFVFRESAGLEFDKNGFDVVPTPWRPDDDDGRVLVRVREVRPGALRGGEVRWTYLGHDFDEDPGVLVLGEK